MTAPDPTALRLPRALMTAPLLAGLALLSACSGEFYTQENLREMVCDETGCWHCRDGECVPYSCDETHQCPMQTVCGIDHRCHPGDGAVEAPDGTPAVRCEAHADCADGEICTLAGACVPSPGGGGSGPGTTGGSDAAGPTDATAPEDGTASGPVDASTASGEDAGGTGDDAPASVDPDAGSSDVGLPQHPEDACLTNADCGLNGTCVNGACYRACRADGTCPPGQQCTAAGCRARTGPENACTFSGECGTNHLCSEGTCYRRCGEPTDCRSAERCLGGLCVADTAPALQCSGAGSCGPGLGCVDGKCVAPCAENTACVDPRTSCDAGYCMPVAACFDTTSCGGADCVDGQCAAP
jgi:hypothetical protein